MIELFAAIDSFYLYKVAHDYLALQMLTEKHSDRSDFPKSYPLR